MPDSASDEATAEERPFVFLYSLRVEPDDIDVMNHANNVVYLRWVQEVATAHWRAAATPQQQTDFTWVVLRHEIDYLAPALLGEELEARTWVGKAKGARFERYVEIRRTRDSQPLARACSVWCPLDPATGKPRRIDDALRQRFLQPPD